MILGSDQKCSIQVVSAEYLSHLRHMSLVRQQHYGTNSAAPCTDVPTKMGTTHIAKVLFFEHVSISQPCEFRITYTSPLIVPIISHGLSAVA